MARIFQKIDYLKWISTKKYFAWDFIKQEQNPWQRPSNIWVTVTGPNFTMQPPINETEMKMVFQLIPKFDAFQDNPWPVLFREIDEHYPGNLFILTIREPRSWIKSVVDYFGENSTPMREWIYGAGCPLGNETLYLRRYKQHSGTVINYFKARKKDFLVMNLQEGDGWEVLSNFLGTEKPNDPFPHKNRFG